MSATIDAMNLEQLQTEAERWVAYAHENEVFLVPAKKIREIVDRAHQLGIHEGMDGAAAMYECGPR